MKEITRSEALKFSMKVPLQAPFLWKEKPLRYFTESNGKTLIASGDVGYGAPVFIQAYTLKNDDKINLSTVLESFGIGTQKANIVMIYSTSRILVEEERTRYTPSRQFIRYLFDDEPARRDKHETNKYSIVEDYEFLEKIYCDAGFLFGYGTFLENLFIGRKLDGKIVALCGTHLISRHISVPSVAGFVWVDPNHRNNGMGSEMVLMMTSFLHDAIKTNVVWDVELSNTASRRMFEKMGAKRTNEEFCLHNIKLLREK